MFGTGIFGTSSFGGGAAYISISKAFAASTRSIRVTLSDEPQNVGAHVSGDVLNPVTWNVTRGDTGQVFTVLSVAAIDPPLVYDVTVLEPLGPLTSTHTIASETLKAAGGSLIVAPKSADFQGMLAVAVATPDAIASGRRFAVRDIANRPTPGDDRIGGTLIITSAGDYAPVEGTELVRKLILRRLTTSPGGFFHLPAYGIGLRVKEPLPSADLVKLKAEIRRQILLESEVEDADVSPTFKSAQNLLIVQMRVKLRATGQQLDMTFQAQPTVAL